MLTGPILPAPNAELRRTSVNIKRCKKCHSQFKAASCGKGKSKMNFMLHLWGGFFNKEYSDFHKKKPGYYWFASSEEREVFLNNFKTIEKELNAHMLAYEKIDGEDSRTKTIAKMTLVYKGNRYSIQNDFGYGFPVESAEFMFYDGNYSCDCNKSMFIAKKYKDFETMDCGDEIEIEDFKIIKSKPIPASCLYME